MRSLLLTAVVVGATAEIAATRQGSCGGYRLDANPQVAALYLLVLVELGR